MILTFQIVIFFIALTSDVSTQPLRRSEQENYFFSEELSKPLKSLDSDYIPNKNVHEESLFSQKGPNAQPNINEGLRKAIVQAPVTPHLGQKLTLNHGYNQTKASDLKEFPRIDIPKPIEYYKNNSSEKDHDIQNETVKIQPCGLFNSSRVHSNEDMINTRGVFPEEQFSQDVLASVQKEGFNGFPKSKNQQFILKKNVETAHGTHNDSLETKSGHNSLLPAEKYDYTNIEFSTTTENIYFQKDEKKFTTEKSTNLTNSFVNGIREAQVQLTEENGKFNNETEVVTSQEKLRIKNNQLKKVMDQKKEDDLRIQNAKYTFSTSQKDGISDLLHDRTETRQDGKVTGSYTYSDGFLLRKVNYVADKNGYRIISEDSVALPGNGPKVNPEGTAHIKTDVSGYRVHYVVHGEKLPKRSSHRQAQVNHCLSRILSKMSNSLLREVELCHSRSA